MTDILVPIDFSPSARRAAELASDDAATRGLGVVLLHVCAPQESITPWASPALDKTPRAEIVACQNALEDLARSLRHEHPSVDYHCLVREGDAAETILAACTQSVARIVCGRRGQSSIAGLGSVVEALLRDAPVPVVLVPPPAISMARSA